MSFAEIRWDFAQLIRQKLIYFLLSLATKCLASVYAESVSRLHQPQCCQPECPPAMSVRLCWPLATVHSDAVTVHSGLSECTVTSPECTVASGQGGVTDMAGGYSGR